MDEIKEKFKKLHIEVEDTLFEEDAPDFYNYPALYYLSRSIVAMGKVDAVYFAKNWQLARGCYIEREIARFYGVKILDTDFLEKKEELVRTPVEPIFMPCDLSTPIHTEPYKITCDTSEKKFGPIDPLDPLSRYYEDDIEQHIPKFV